MEQPPSTIDLTNIETTLSAIQSTTETLEKLLTEINQTALDTETSLSNVDQNTFDILTTLSKYVASNSGGTPPPSPPPSPTDTVDLTEVESLLDSIDQTAFDILTAIGNINSNSTGRNNPPSNPPSPGPDRPGGTDFASLLQQNQYLSAAMNALNNDLNIRDELAALLRAQQPTLGQDDLDEQLTEILRGITVPLNSSVKTEE